jgi:hypothetical protein
LGFFETLYLDDTDRSDLIVTIKKNSGNNTAWGDVPYITQLRRSTLTQYWRLVLLKAAVNLGIQFKVAFSHQITFFRKYYSITATILI